MMSVELFGGRAARNGVAADHPGDELGVSTSSQQPVGAPGAAGRSTDTVETLLQSVAGGDQQAFAALERRMAGLVRVNVCRVLCDASRSEAVTQQTFAEVRDGTVHFDARQGNAQTWLLSRAHQRATDELRQQSG